MTDLQQLARAKFAIMSAVNAAQEEGFTAINIPSLWGGTLCIYIGWESYMRGVSDLARDGAFKIVKDEIRIKRRQK